MKHCLAELVRHINCCTIANQRVEKPKIDVLVWRLSCHAREIDDYGFTAYRNQKGRKYLLKNVFVWINLYALWLREIWKCHFFPIKLWPHCNRALNFWSIYFSHFLTCKNVEKCCVPTHRIPVNFDYSFKYKYTCSISFPFPRWNRLRDVAALLCFTWINITAI